MSAIVRTAVLGNLADYVLGARRLERVPIRSDDLAKRIVRLTTSAGDVGLRFDGADGTARAGLCDGDVVYADAALVVAVCVEPDDVLVCRPATLAQAVSFAHALGNRHLPIAQDGDSVVVRFDPLLPALATEHGVAWTRERRVLGAALRHPFAPHAHG